MTLAADATVVVVGAGLAGLRTAETLRAAGHTGPVVLIGAEPHPPYDRPPLSKQLLAGTWGLDRVVLRRPDELAALGVDLRLGHVAGGLDSDARTVRLDDGATLRYDALVVATGSRPRAMAGTDGVAGVHVLRTLEDCFSLAEATADPKTRLVVIGAGFIGSEVAATCKGRGLDVTVLEALPVPLARVLGEVMGEACAGLHRSHGVEVRTGAAVAGLAHEGGAVRGVELVDGSVVPADVVVVGIGVTPVTDWLEESGLEIDNGVVCDATLHAADDVVVAGDVARWFDRAQDRHRRIEHWENATEQGQYAARSLMAGRAGAEPYSPVPYFWSDQYDVKIQMLGSPEPDHEVVVVDGTLQSERFVAVYGSGGRLTGALGMSKPRQLMGFRPLLERGASFDEALSLLAG